MPWQGSGFALSLRGTLTRVALVGRDGHLSQRHEIPTLAHLGRDDVLDRFVTALEQVASRADSSSLMGVGVSVASPTDPKTGTMCNPPNLPGRDGCPTGPR